MGRKSKRKNKPKVKSKKTRNSAYGELGYSQMNRNAKTVRKILKAEDDEKEIDK